MLSEFELEDLRALAHLPMLSKSMRAVCAKSAQLLQMKPVLYAVTCYGEFTKNVYQSESEAQKAMATLNALYAKGERALVPLFAQADTIATTKGTVE